MKYERSDSVQKIKIKATGSSLGETGDLRNYRSPVTNPKFFLSPNGAQNAERELTESIEIFSRDLPSSDENPQCRYPARYSLLKEIYPLAKPVPCPSFDHWRENYGVTSINILYGSQFISTPTSAFGHSFFLIDSVKTMEYARTTYNYGAEIPENVGLRLVIDGLGGGFRGNFSVVPLYERLYSYSDIENRDIWEYTLNLTEAERDFLVKYLREMEKYFEAPYYFLSGNCASEILEMLNVVRPGLNLKTSSPLFTSPQEIFRVLDRAGLVLSVNLRPSLQKRLDASLLKLTDDQKRDFEKIISARMETPRNSELAEAVLNFVKLKRQSNKNETPANLKNVERGALLARAESRDAPVADRVTYDSRLQDHDSAPHRAQPPNILGLGRARLEKQNGTKFSFRPAFHDLMQTDAGFLPNSSVDFFALDASIPDHENFRIDTFTLAQITNFREVKTYDPRATSWKIGGHIQRNFFYENRRRYYLEVSPEIGFAKSIFAPSVLAFALASFDLREGSLGPIGKWAMGPRLGLIATMGRFKTYLTYKMMWQSAEAAQTQLEESAAQVRYNLTQQWDLLTEYKRSKFHSEAGASLRFSF